MSSVILLERGRASIWDEERGSADNAYALSTLTYVKTANCFVLHKMDPYGLRVWEQGGTSGLYSGS
ncbi:hypothetical protein MY8738_003301 [Beauveria namnaoensis]